MTPLGLRQDCNVNPAAAGAGVKAERTAALLPAAVAGDAERLARFDREAKTLASLNHPNVAAIYGLEQSASAKTR